MTLQTSRKEKLENETKFINFSKSCVSSGENNIATIELDTGKYIIIANFTYAGNELRYCLAIGNSSITAYDTSGWVNGSVSEILTLNEKTNITVKLWVSKNCDVSGNVQIIKL